MKIGVLSDTHIPERVASLPPALVKGLQGSDMILHAGDMVDYAVIKELKKICPQVRAVWGNMDPDDIRKRYPQKDVFTVGGFRFVLLHGWGAPQHLVPLLERELKADNPDVVVFGHSHQPLNERHGKVLFFNPGSATDTVFAPYPSYGIIEIAEAITARIVKL